MENDGLVFFNVSFYVYCKQHCKSRRVNIWPYLIFSVLNVDIALTILLQNANFLRSHNLYPVCSARVYGSFLGYGYSIVLDGTGIRKILRSIFFVLSD